MVAVVTVGINLDVTTWKIDRLEFGAHGILKDYSLLGHQVFIV
jgi:hypothetical protein